MADPLKDSNGNAPPEHAARTFRVGVSEDRNRKCRRTMEDAHAFLYDFAGVTGQGYFAVFDGHAGKTAAEWCGANFHKLLLAELDANPAQSIPDTLNAAFHSVDLQLSKLAAKDGSHSGCTAVTAFLRLEDDNGNQYDPAKSSSKPKRTLYVANVGDARAVLSRSGKAVRLTYDHKGSDPQEAKRITDAGGFVMNNRVNGVLAVTRSLGDSSMKEFVVGSPYTTETTLSDDDNYLIVACDGLWDVTEDQDAVNLISKMSDPQHASKTLLEHALSSFSTDNLSVMVIALPSAMAQSQQ